MTLGHPFKLCSNDSILLDLYIANDIYIESTYIDALPLLFSQPPSGLAANYEMFAHFSQTVFLTAGTHTINIDVSNLNISTPSENPTGLGIYGTVSSATGTSSLVSESNPSCSTYVCGTIGPAACDSISLPDTLRACSEIPIVLPAILYGSDSVLSIEWTPTTGISDPTILDPTVSTGASGSYYLTVQSTISGVLCIATDSVYVDVIAPGITYGHSDTSICALVSGITLNAPGGYISYVWNTGATTPYINEGSGIYWVDASNSCTSFIDTFYVTSVPATVSTSVKDTTVCEGNSITLRAPRGYSSYLWSTGSSANSVIAESGVYWVSASVICALVTDTFFVASIPTPIVNLGNDTSICEGNSITLYATEPLGSKYLWSNGSTEPSISVSAFGTYTLTVTQSGCSVSSTVTISGLYKPAAIDLGQDTTLCDGQQMILAVNDPGGSLRLNTGDTKQEITVTEPGNYWVTASNICGSVSDTINVTFGACDIGVPGAFSPNGDGRNDVLYVRGSGIKTLTLKIFDRWGHVIFVTTNQQIGWDGTYNGQPQAVDVYAWVLNATFFDGVTKVLKGNVTLLR